jgi:hypothetical protein
MNTDIQKLITDVSGRNVFGMSYEQVRVALSRLIGDADNVLIYLTYPKVDELNHKSRDMLVSKLSGHGFAETAELVEKECPYLAFNDKKKALKVYHEIQRDSLAVGATLYYKGLTDLAAVNLILDENPKEAKAGLHLVTHRA